MALLSQVITVVYICEVVDAEGVEPEGQKGFDHIGNVCLVIL